MPKQTDDATEVAVVEHAVSGQCGDVQGAPCLDVTDCDRPATHQLFRESERGNYTTIVSACDTHIDDAAEHFGEGSQ